ncbi:MULTISPECIES: AraC family transcriptional regulator [Gracilibacillus]|uniref:Cupin domain-containing protein n=1 Tax=Gracilibacillus dipsosauri TaxID=178340 RepID=A0A317KTH5_9BACI|nr:AraC family transcriptional regulator [Gracilibacillus dipsosauri]PWU66831.1 cupin domain-containing protein [Gracilibacillus dipsosauri]
MLDLNVFPQAVAYYFKEWKEFEMPFHHHEATEIMYVISGSCRVEINNECIGMRKGQYIIIQSHIPHRLVVEKNRPCRMLNLEFEWRSGEQRLISLEKLAKLDDSFPSAILSEEPFFILRDADHIYYTLRNLVFELDNQSNENSMMIDNLLLQLLLIIARQRREQNHEENGRNENYVKKVITYIHENYDHDITVEQLANVAHIHPSYLHRIFKQSTGMTLHEYISRVRIEKAKMLLEKTDIAVTEISSYVGINTSQYFSSVFRRSTGLSPSNYRRHFRDI